MSDMTTLPFRPNLRTLTLALVLALGGGLLAACSDADDPDSPDAGPTSLPRVSEGARPANLPAAARLVDSDLSVGQTSSGGLAREQQHLLFTLACSGDLLSLITTHETVYAELPCERTLPPTLLAPFTQQPVQIRVRIGEPSKLFFENSVQGTVEFTVGQVWIEHR
jgi:hypothetical protein